MGHHIVIRPVREDELEIFTEVIRQSFATVATDFGLTEQNCPTNGPSIRAERLASDRRKGDMAHACWAGRNPPLLSRVSTR